MTNLMINSGAPVRGSSCTSWGGSSHTQEGSSSLLSVGGPLFWLAPVCSWEELWFLVVLDNASLLLPRNTAAAVFITIISSQSSTTSACNGSQVLLLAPNLRMSHFHTMCCHQGRAITVLRERILQFCRHTFIIQTSQSHSSMSRSAVKQKNSIWLHCDLLTC